MFHAFLPRVKPAIVLAVLAFAVLFAPTPSSAGNNPDLQVIASVFPPYSYDKNNHAEGIAVNVARKAFAKIGMNPTIEVYPWARALSIAEHRPNTLFFSVARTPARENKFQWVGTVIDFNVKVYKKASRTDIDIQRLQDLKPYTFAGLIKDVKTEYLKRLGAYVHDVSNEENAFKMLQLGHVDLVASDQSAAEFRLKKLGYNLDDFAVAYSLDRLSKPLYIVASKGTDLTLVEQLRAALQTTKDEQQN